MVTKEKAQGGLGVRSMRQLNSAFLMKLGWRLQTESTALWSQLLHEKYSRGRELLSVTDRRLACSNAWKGIKDTLQLTDQGMGFAIGDGRSTKFWVHRWMDGTKLAEQATVHIPADHLHRTLCDYWDLSSGWKWDQLDSLLPTLTVKRIASFALASAGVSDEQVWLLDKSGHFTIKSAIKLSRQDELNGGTSWAWMWRVCIPQRIKLFLWLILYGKVLTNEQRFHRNMSQSPHCGVCSGKVENLEHVLRSCPQATQVWHTIQAHGLNYIGAEGNCTQWLLLNVRGSHEDPDWPTKFIITVWYI